MQNTPNFFRKTTIQLVRTVHYTIFVTLPCVAPISFNHFPSLKQFSSRQGLFCLFSNFRCARPVKKKILYSINLLPADAKFPQPLISSLQSIQIHVLIACLNRVDAVATPNPLTPPRQPPSSHKTSRRLFVRKCPDAPHQIFLSSSPCTAQCQTHRSSLRYPPPPSLICLSFFAKPRRRFTMPSVLRHQPPTPTTETSLSDEHARR